MLKTTSSASTNPNLAALIALKPRQVLLVEHRAKTLAMTKKQSNTTSLNPEQKAFLLHSVIRYLEKNGYSKSLKRFLSEAQIQNEDWKSSSLDLEDLYCKYLDTCNHAQSEFNTSKKEDDTANGNICAASDEFSKKKKKKKSCGESDSNVAADRSEDTDKKLRDSVKNSENVDYVSKAKSKGKKKSKKNSDSPDQNEQVQSHAVKKHVEITVSEERDELIKKSKDKKKKKSASISESSVNNAGKEKIETLQGVIEEQPKDLASAECDFKKEKKSSKKRKRLASDENELMPVDKEANEELKRRKSEGLEESKKKDKLTIDDGGKESKQENRQLDNNESPKTSMKQLDDPENGDFETNGSEMTNKHQLNGHANGNSKKNGDKFTSQKSTKKQHNGSAEPKTINAFQRVKIDEVEFADEKLQDNSYWAKDGAEIGYGAKAQEVLGQVRGRDFRHEKTKKKRGSYRGGMIDLQSHSVKFNYSDED